MKKYKNKVFVLGLADSGYYIVRALHQAQVPVIAFESRRERPEFRTRLCEKKISVSDEDELIEKLYKTAAQEYEKPVLFLPSDTYVDFFIRERNLLEKLFLINFPKNETIKTLLYKDKFAEYAIENNLKIPKTIIIKNYQGFESGLNVIHFPIILKPFLRTYKWKAAKLPKIFYLNDRYSAISLYKKISKIENRYIIQEWIPGPDSNIYFCLVYFGSYNNCIASFTGRKLKQWPIGLGTTASAEPVSDQQVTATTINFFKNIGYAGFGSMEYKKGMDGHYYIMEPTVGRPNQQSHIVTANGINMPLMAYNHLTGSNLTAYKKVDKGVRYIDEYQEIASAFVMIKNRKLTLSSWIRSLMASKTFRFMNKDDIYPFIYSIIFMLKRFVNMDFYG